MSYRHSARRSKRVDDKVIGGIASAMGRASEPELQAAMAQHLRARNLRATFWRAADIAISYNGGLPVAAEFHEDALVLWPNETSVMPHVEIQPSTLQTETLIGEQVLPLTDELCYNYAVTEDSDVHQLMD